MLGQKVWRNVKVIESPEESSTHRNTLLTYETRRKGLGLDKQIKEECTYWEHVLQRVIAVMCTLAEKGLAIRGTAEQFRSLQFFRTFRAAKPIRSIFSSTHNKVRHLWQWKLFIYIQNYYRRVDPDNRQNGKIKL